MLTVVKTVFLQPDKNKNDTQAFDLQYISGKMQGNKVTEHLHQASEFYQLDRKVFSARVGDFADPLLARE